MYAHAPQDAVYRYTRTPQQVVDLYHERLRNRGPVLAQMRAIRDQANGDIVVPLPELDRDEQSFVPNLLVMGIDNYGARAASVMPDLTCPPVDARKPRAVERADVRRRATLKWWEESKVRRQMRRRARWLFAYGTAPALIRPDFGRGIPVWELRNPLDSFPSPTINPDDLCPDDTIHAVWKPYRWLKAMYPQAAAALAPDNCNQDFMFTVLEYDDAEQRMCVVVGNTAAGGGFNPSKYAPYVVLEQVPNRAGCPLTVVPGRITLDRVTGQFDGMLGIYQMQAKLMALGVIHAQKSVFPDTYLVSRANETAKIISGPHPGYTGLITEVEGGEIREVRPSPDFNTNAVIDRLERAQRMTGGIPAEFGGESTTNVRTGRRGDAILSAVVDFPVQEAQETLGYALEEENYRATKIAKAYFGNIPKSFHVNWKGAKGHVGYTPDKDFDSDYSQVTYAAPGSDINNLSIAIGQRVGIGTMSKETAMKLDPMVEDAEREKDAITAEGLEMAMLQGLQQQASQGVIPPGDVARIMELVREQNVPLAQAVMQAQREAQERQATEDAAGADTSVAPGSPEAQPGLALPGMGAEAGVAVSEPPTALGNLDQLLMQMRGTSPSSSRGA